MFGLHILKSGRIETEFAVILTAGQEDRELGDYDVSFEMEEDRAKQRLDDAHRFLERMRRHLSETSAPSGSSQ